MGSYLDSARKRGVFFFWVQGEDVLIGAVAIDCGDTGAIYLRDRVRQAVGHYAMVRVKQYKKQRKQ